MDTTRFAEGQFLNPELVKTSPTKKVYITGDAKEETNKFGNPQLTLPVEIDNKNKIWGLRMDHVKALQEAYGKESKAWIGQIISLRVVVVNGKEQLIAIPEASRPSVQEVVR